MRGLSPSSSIIGALRGTQPTPSHLPVAIKLHFVSEEGVFPSSPPSGQWRKPPFGGPSVLKGVHTPNESPLMFLHHPRQVPLCAESLFPLSGAHH